MPLHPLMQAIREQRLRDGTRPLYEMTLEQAREADLASITSDRGATTPVGTVTELTIPGPEGDLAARLYRPDGPGPFPVLLYFFGGGWTLGNLDTSDEVCRRLCAGAECLVTSVAYRLAPEHPFPAATHDCFAAVLWAAKHVNGHGGDSARLAVAGDSAGGNLAAAVTLQARTGGPPLTCQVLVYPNTEYGADTESMRENADPSFFNSRSVAWYWANYLARPEDGRNPLASPLRARDLRGLPPALVITAEYDPLRDEGEAYAARLAEAGVPVTRTRYDGMPHGFFTMTGTLEPARRATDEVVAYLRAAFAR
jgi:acetyl esterase